MDDGCWPGRLARPRDRRAFHYWPLASASRSPACLGSCRSGFCSWHCRRCVSCSPNERTVAQCRRRLVRDGLAASRLGVMSHSRGPRYLAERSTLRTLRCNNQPSYGQPTVKLRPGVGASTTDLRREAGAHAAAVMADHSQRSDGHQWPEPDGRQWADSDGPPQSGFSRTCGASGCLNWFEVVPDSISNAVQR